MITCPDHRECVNEVPFKNILEHLRTVHKLKEPPGEERGNAFVVTMEFGQKMINFKNPDNKWIQQIISFGRKHFVLIFTKRDNMHYAYVYLIGDHEEAKSYGVTISVKNGQSCLSLVSEVFPIDMKQDDILNESVFSLPNNKMGETFFVDQQDLSGSQDQKKKIMLRYKIVKLESQNSAPQPMSSSVGQYMHEGKDEGEGDVKTPRF